MEISTSFSDPLTISEIACGLVYWIRFGAFRATECNAVSRVKNGVSTQFRRVSVPIIRMDVTGTVSETLYCNPAATTLITQEDFTGVSSFSVWN
jgi:hypothetical protein